MINLYFRLFLSLEGNEILNNVCLVFISLSRD